MKSPDQLSDALFAVLASVENYIPDQTFLTAISGGIKQLTIYRILELRQKICRELDVDSPLVSEALEMINGQIALREIAGRARWR